MTRTWDDMLLAQQQAAEVQVGYEVGRLAREWVLPPFSILDSTSGAWRERRRAWLALGIESELGRGEAGERKGALNRVVTMFDYAPGDWRKHAAYRRDADERSDLTGAAPLPEYADLGTARVAPGTSIFDPVLCELAYRWWCPAGGSILDPFAGGSVRGVMAALLGHPYTGIDLSADQVAANREQAQRIVPPDRPMPRWYVGDSLEVLPDLPAGLDFDMVFTCPPYYDLEVYSDHPADLSAMPTYAAFVDAYQDILAAAIRRLNSDRFAVVVVSDLRDKQGFYYGLRRDTELAMERASMRLYNDGTVTGGADPSGVQDIVRKWDEAKLINPVGTLAMRTHGQFTASRKLGRTHQDVLVFARSRPATHDWDKERTAPPAPQADMGLLPPDPPPPVQVPLLAPLDTPEAPVPEAVVSAAPPTPAAPRPEPAQDGPQPVAVPTAAPLPDRAAQPAVVAETGRWTYRLTDAEVALVLAMAQQVAQANAEAGRVERAGARPDDEVARKMRGFGGELALARMLDLPWQPVVIGDVWQRLPDLPGVEVRTRARAEYDLFLYGDEDDFTPYVLLTGTADGALTARGWVYGREGKVARYEQQPGGVRTGSARYWVPQADLRAMDSLPAVLARRAAEADHAA